MEEMWMITPDPCFSIPGSSRRSRRTAANRLVLIVFCQSSSLRASTPPLGEEDPPTQLTRMSTPPKRFRTSPTTFSYELNPDTKYSHNWHIEAIAEALEKC